MSIEARLVEAFDRLMNSPAAANTYKGDDAEYMFQIRDTFGGTKLLLEQLEQDTREGFDAACTAAAFMAERGELIRRRLGYAPGEIPDADTFRLLVPTYEIVDLKNAVIKAVTLGYGREVKSAEDDEYDEGLEELRQKKTPSSGRNTTA